MSTSSSGRTWEAAASPTAVELARRFETEWQDAPPGSPRPSLAAYLAASDGTSGARLAFLRADLTLRFQDGERVDPNEYAKSFPNLDDETFVALVYEEFCLREEAGETPDPARYLERYPKVAEALRRVLDIHGLVISAETQELDTIGHGRNETEFPSEGETIAGFRLAEELGRGAFARVFRAEERQLSDRPVALKVARNGSREPQTLARLQHTNIVPVYSYRTDPVTGLHLLCMPYYGRITLARILADPAVRDARNGAELVAVIDRLEASGTSSPFETHSTGRDALVKRSYAQAIAWWGARMAEALNHAHERGVLHRDVKPSNVLVTSDAMPMLLDFNLAREVNLDDAIAEEAVPGGTLDYMAPEHIEEMIDGISDRVGVRSDIYGLGVLLFEALMGERPFPPPKGATTALEMLRRAAKDRRTGIPRLRTRRPEVPAALEAVIRRCLVPDPAGRYGSASDLAADLQAVADDLPLVHAHEPLPDRTVRWFRRHRRAIAAIAPVVLAVILAAGLVLNARNDREVLISKVKRLYDEGSAAADSGDYARAAVLYNSAVTLVDKPDRSRDEPRSQSPSALWTSLAELRQQAHNRQLLAEQTHAYRNEADKLPALIEPLRFGLIGFGGELASVTPRIQHVLEPFHVFDPGDWTDRPDFANRLDEPRRARVKREVNELLFLWAVALEEAQEPKALAQSIRLCDKAEEFATPAGPWRALRKRAVAKLEGRSEADSEAPAPADETSPVACFEWAYLKLHERKREEAQAFLKKAVNLEPGNAWYHYCLGWVFEDPTWKNSTEALSHYDAALALKPQSPWIRFSRARVYRSRSAWAAAMEDFQRALSDVQAIAPEFRETRFESRIRLELGLVRQSLGDHAGARADYDRIILDDGPGPFARAARLNRAKLDADSGDVLTALREYQAIVDVDPDDHSARLGLAMIALRAREPERAEQALTDLLGKVNHPEAFAYRALARLWLGKLPEALADADQARRRSSPNVERIRARVLVALGRIAELRPTDPDEFLTLPLNGKRLRDDLRRFVERGEADGARQSVDACLTRAVVLSALGESRALQEADRAVSLAPDSTRVYLIRARVRRHAGRRELAMEDVQKARSLDPDDPRIWVLSARLRLDSNDPRRALAELDRAILKGADGTGLRSTRAEAFLALQDPTSALREWSEVLALDPADPTAYLGRAETYLVLNDWDRALADLEQAASWTEDRPMLSLRITRGFLRVVPQRPKILARVLSQCRSVVASLLATHPQP